MKIRTIRALSVCIAALICLSAGAAALGEGTETVNPNELYVTLSVDGDEAERVAFTATSMEIESDATVMVFVRTGRTGVVEQQITITLPGNWEADSVYTQDDDDDLVYGYCSIKFENCQSGLDYTISSAAFGTVSLGLSVLYANDDYTACAGTFDGKYSIFLNYSGDTFNVVMTDGVFYADKALLDAASSASTEATEAPGSQYIFATAAPAAGAAPESTQAPAPTVQIGTGVSN